MSASLSSILESNKSSSVVKTEKGTDNWQTKNIYIGDYVDGKRHGYGIQVNGNGSRYEGNWFEDRIGSEGTLSVSVTTQFITTPSLNFKNSSVPLIIDGTYYYSSGNIYAGEFKNSKKDGYGVLKYKQGGRYSGKWCQDMKEGHGIQIYSNGNIYEGEWSKNKRHGYGVQTYKSGNKYEGFWSLDNLDGQGTYFYKSMHIYQFNFPIVMMDASTREDGKITKNMVTEKRNILLDHTGDIIKKIKEKVMVL